MLPIHFQRRFALLDRWPEEEALNCLDEIGVRYILVHVFQGDQFETEDLPHLLDNPRLALIERFPTPIGDVRDIYLFELLG